MDKFDFEVRADPANPDPDNRDLLLVKFEVFRQGVPKRTSDRSRLNRPPASTSGGVYPHRKRTAAPDFPAGINPAARQNKIPAARDFVDPTSLHWADHRVGHRKFLDAMLLEHIPGGARWRYVWGSCLAFVFTIQLVTGVLLMTAYSPSDTGAWASVHFIQYQMDFGWLIRGLHHFGSQGMVVLLAVHMLQVVIAGARTPPRRVNWWPSWPSRWGCR